MRNLINDTISACKDGIPAAIIGVEVLGLDWSYFETPLAVSITGPVEYKEIHKNTSIPIMIRTYEMFQALIQAIEKSLRPNPPAANANKKDKMHYHKMIEKNEALGAYTFTSKMFPFTKILKVACRDPTFAQSKPLFS